MNRLFVTSLKSIGLVSEGDNPDADVVIWKSHGERERTDLITQRANIETSNTTALDQRVARLNQLFGPNTDGTETPGTATPNTESFDQHIARLTRNLADLNRRIARLKEKRKRRLANLANIPPKERKPNMTDKEPQALNEMVVDKLDSYARKQQFEGEIKGRYGYLSTPREEMVVKIRVAWWDTPGGKAVKELLREKGGDPADLTLIAKSHSEATAAIAQLDG